jgi:16S rRNA (guanine1207-N2)-methyltransferase
MEGYQYQFELRSNNKRGRENYSFETSDGVASKDGFREAELLLADSVETERDDDILVLGSGYGFLGVLFADYTPEGYTLLAETSDRAYQISNHNLELNDIEGADCRKVASPAEIEERFDKVLYAPKPYSNTDVVKNRLTDATDLLNEGGELYISSGKKEGLKRYRDWLNRFKGELVKIESRNGYSVYRYRKQGEVEDRKIDVERGFEAEFNCFKGSFETIEGLFSPNALDEGSRLLIENIEADAEDKIWDVACGYGAVGIFLDKLYDVELFLSDDDMRAVEVVKMNLELNDVSGKVGNADCLDAFEGQEFDKIVTNPPTHQGSAVTDEIFRNANSRLKRGGEFYAVYNQNMSYEDQLEQIFDKVNILERKDNFAVVRAVK